MVHDLIGIHNSLLSILFGEGLPRDASGNAVKTDVGLLSELERTCDSYPFPNDALLVDSLCHLEPRFQPLNT